MKEAGAHRLTYLSNSGRYVDIKVTKVSTLDGPWLDISKTKIPEGKTAFVRCPKCKSNDWNDDSIHLNGFSCGGCGFEIVTNCIE